MPTCVLCENEIDRWHPSPRRDAASPVARALEVVGSDLEDTICPRCGADGRERHAWMYLASTGVLDDTVNRRALHVGAEPRLREKLATLPIDWTFCEASTLDALLAAAGPEFHLVICNRVLAAVDDAEAAIRGLASRLAADGWLVAQCAFSPLLQRTLAFTCPTTDRAAYLFFGEETHRRLFGADVGTSFAAAGLQGGPYRHEDVLPGLDGPEWGLDPREPFFLFSRRKCLVSPS